MIVHNKHLSILHYLLLMLLLARIAAALHGGDMCRDNSRNCNAAAADPSTWLSDLQLWNPRDMRSQISQKVLNSWCNDTVRDAARHVLELGVEASVLKQEKLSCQRALAEKKEEWRVAKSQLRVQFLEEKRQLQSSWMEKELLLKVKLSEEREAMAADLAHCRTMRQAMISAEECNYQKQMVLSKCDQERSVYSAEYDVQRNSLSQSSNVDKDLELESCADSMAQQQARVKWLEDSLGHCRYERAEAKAVMEVQPEVQDPQSEDLRRLIRILSGLLVASVTLCLGLAAALGVCLLSSVQDDSGPKSSKMAAFGTNPQMLTSEEACGMLRTIFENNGLVSSILTAPDSSSTDGASSVFMLVPVNLSSSRRFALFGGGGDFTRQVEVAKDFVSGQLENKRLVIVLYKYGGHAFAQNTLSSLGLSADKLAFEAVPKDQDFPSDDDVLVLWTSERQGLQVSDSGGESELAQVIKQQSWAHYLGKRGC